MGKQKESDLDKAIDEGLENIKQAYKDPENMHLYLPVLGSITHEEADPYNIEGGDHTYPPWGKN